MKKILTISTLLVIVLMLSLLPVFAAETEERNTQQGTFVTVSDITNEDTIHAESGDPTVNVKVTKGDNNKDTVEVTYYAASLKAVEEDEEIHRPAGYAWLGVRLYPSSGTDYTYVTFDDGTGEELSDVNNHKCEDYYIGVSKENLEKAVKEGKDLVYTDTITWYKNKEATEPESDAPVTNLKIIVKAKDMVVYDETDSKEEWNEETYNKAVAEYEAAKKAEAQKDKTPKTGI